MTGLSHEMKVLIGVDEDDVRKIAAALIIFGHVRQYDPDYPEGDGIMCRYCHTRAKELILIDHNDKCSVLLADTLLKNMDI